jgi:hypothetical protein
MFIRIFKAVTSLSLLAFFIVLINGREMTSVTKNAQGLLAEKIASGEVLLHRNPKVSEIPPLPKGEIIVKNTEQEVKPSASSPSSTNQKSPTKEVVPTIQKSSVYVQMNEGTSDAEVSYKPLISPCVTPMGYKIGRFDTQFGISKELFIKELESASSLWNTSHGSTLFYYDENGPLTINLIYDERQAKTVDIGYLTLEIQNSKNAADTVQQSYEQEKIDYERDGERFTEDSKDFQARSKAYEAKVSEYNTKGGASASEYNAMMIELGTLKADASALDARRDDLNKRMTIINAKVAHYNQLIDYTNTLIKKSNSLGIKKFTEGRFSSANNTIDIYQYSDLAKLRRVLAHELGHALGIDHNSNISSIMYSVNSATTTMLSKEDLEALSAVCAH